MMGRLKHGQEQLSTSYSSTKSYRTMTWCARLRYWRDRAVIEFVVKTARTMHLVSRLSSSAEAQQPLGIGPPDLEAIALADRHAFEPV
jgi:hypothetical protein